MTHPIEIVWTFMVDYAKDWGVRRHSHDYFQMYYCIAGRGTMLLGDQNIVLEKDNCLLICRISCMSSIPLKAVSSAQLIPNFMYMTTPSEMLSSVRPS